MGEQNGGGAGDTGRRSDAGGVGASRRATAVHAEYETIFEAIDDAIFVVDVEHDESGLAFRFRRCNPSLETLTGIPTAEFCGHTPREVFGETDGGKVEAQFRPCVESGDPVEFEQTLEHATGTVEWQVNLTPIVDGGAVTQLVGIARDVTDRNERERTIQRAERRLSLALEAADAGVWEWNVGPDAVIWGPSMEELVGLERGAFEGTYEAFLDRVHPEDRDGLRAVVEDAVDRGTGFEHEFRMRHESGAYRWIITRAEWFDDAGVPGVDDERLIGVGIDITDRKARERALDRNRDRLRVLFDQAPDGIVVHDAEGYVYDVNEALVDALGYDREELLAMRVTDFEVGVDPDELEERWAAMEPGTMQHVEIEGVHRRRDGSTYPVDVWVSKVTPDARDGPLFVAICRDVTDTVAYERELERHTELVENVPVGIYRNTPGEEGEFLNVNPAMVDLFDADSREQLLECDVRDLYADPDERSAFAERLESEGVVTEA